MIQVLEKNISDKIAAGEVVERPVSIVKELVENSIDAGAKSITVEIKNGGKSYIRVTDDGCGIPFDEAEIAFLRHATSKIKSAADLDSIETLGFRGEALASIAAVTRTELVTKTKDEKAGARLIVYGGETVSCKHFGCPEGTTIIVKDLFFNTPAREKFMKSDAAEAGRIIDTVSRIAVSVPNIRFSLINNGKVLFATAGKGNLKNAIMEVYKEKRFQELIDIDLEYQGVRTFGCISKPDFSRNSRKDQYFFVNGRTVKSRTIERGLEEGYRERLFEGRFPVAFVFIKTDPLLLDVNIHPGKKEVRFDDSDKIIDAVSKAVKKSLMTKEAVGNVVEPAEIRSKSEEQKKKKFPEPIKINTVTVSEPSVFMEYKEEEIKQPDIKEILAQKRAEIEKVKDTEPKPEIEEKLFTAAESTKAPFDFECLNFRTIIFGTYIVAEDNDTMYLIDQHAAHERVFYEKLMGEYEKSEKNGQVLMIPITIDVSTILAEDDSRWTKLLRNMGYRIDIFGDNTYIVREVPQFMTMEEAESFLREFIDLYSDETEGRNRVVIDKLITRSCKSAIKAHDYITREEAEALFEQLSMCRNPFSCPHGRPTFIKYNIYELERMFKRA